jgi:hypothetical protein
VTMTFQSSLVPDALWVNGWVSARTGWALRLVQRDGHRWAESLASPTWMLGERAFEPSLKPLDRCPTGNIQVSVDDLSRVSALVNPGELVGRLIPPARTTDHMVFVVETPTKRVYLPAMLLIQELWLWSKAAARVLLTPNGVDVHVGRPAERGGVVECSSSRLLASIQPSDTALRRLAWLSQCEDARHSWSSVLTLAHRGVLGMSLPRAHFSSWAWGIDVGTGLLACELMSTNLRFDLPHSNAAVRIGRALHELPPESPPRDGLMTY